MPKVAQVPHTSLGKLVGGVAETQRGSPPGDLYYWLCRLQIYGYIDE